MTRLVQVDGLRTVAMTMVIALHCRLMPFGWVGVWLFFVISGYVITRGFVLDEARATVPVREQFVGFMKRRALRILPVYLVYLSAGSLLSLQQGLPLVDLPYLLTMTYNWQMILGLWPGHFDTPAFGHLWTLSVEEQFYLLFPFLALVVPQRRRLAVSIAFVCTGPLVRMLASIWLEAFHGPDDQYNAYAVYAATPCHWDAFLMGSLVARLEPKLRQNPAYASRLSAIALAATVAYVAAYAWINYQHGDRGLDVARNIISGVLFGSGREVFVYVAIDLLATALLVHLVLGRFGTAMLAWPPMAWVGRVSYGGYLFHALLIAVLELFLGHHLKDESVGVRVLSFLLAWGCSVALAALSYFKFERPLAQRWSSPKKVSVVRFGSDGSSESAVAE